jgi:hypothetical protein
MAEQIPKHAKRRFTVSSQRRPRHDPLDFLNTLNQVSSEPGAGRNRPMAAMIVLGGAKRANPGLKR